MVTPINPVLIPSLESHTNIIIVLIGSLNPISKILHKNYSYLHSSIDSPVKLLDNTPIEGFALPLDTFILNLPIIACPVQFCCPLTYCLN